MLAAPQNKTGDLQSYSKLWATDQSFASFINVELAPSTNTDGYKPGCILAQLTGGANQGKFINYDPAGADGQNVALAILEDQYLTPEMEKQGTNGDVLVRAVIAGANFYQDQIYFTKQDGTTDAGLLAAAITQLGGKIGFGKVMLFAVGR